MLAACVLLHSVCVQMSRVSCAPRSSTLLTSHPGHVGGGKRGLVSTVCACATTPWFYEVLYTVVNKLLTFSAILTFASLVFLSSKKCLPRTMFCKKDDKGATSCSLTRIIHMFIRCIKVLRHVNGVLSKFTIPLKKVLKQMVVLAAMVVPTRNVSHRKQNPTL